MVYKEPKIDNLLLEYKLLFKNKPKTKILFEPIATNEGVIALQPKNEKAITFINSLINESYLSKEKDYDKSLSNISNISYFNNSFHSNHTLEDKPISLRGKAENH